MLTLCIDTAGADCAVLLAQDGAAAAQARETLGRGHAERLAPMTQDVLRAAGAAPGDLDRIGVVTGPGSFAGIRVGVAFARGLALTLDIPALGLSLFDLLARAYAREPALAVAHDAARGEIALRLYRAGAAQEELRRLSIEDAADSVRAFPDSPLIAGSGAALLAPLVPRARVASDAGADLILLARMIAGADPDTYPPTPLYVRPPDAKLPGGILPGGGG